MTQETREVSDRTIIVTGASAGIGRALAVELARAGARVVLNARRKEELEEVAEVCRESSRAQPVAGDIADDRVVERVTAAAVDLGNFYGFIHDAGVARPGPYLWEIEPEEFRRVVDTSFTAGYLLIRHTFPKLLEQGEGIAVFFGSAAAEVALEGLGAYCAAKAAEEHLARLAAEEAPQLTVFAYRPGIVDTNMQKEAREAEGGAKDVVRKEFRGYKERGALISPEEAAQGLVRILTGNPKRFHGRVCSVRDAP